jgi:hypothetical protein
MPLSFRAAWAGLAVALLPQLATAGPIAWSMRGEAEPFGPGNEFSLGTYTRPIGSGESFEVVHAYGQLPEVLTATGTGPQTYIQLGAQSKQAYRFDTTPADPSPGNRALFRVWVTDVASGETGHLSFFVTAYLLTGLPFTDSSEMVFGGEGGGTLLLGGNRYDVALKASDGDEGTYVSADLVVAPATATPEPGTMALAGLGLAAVGLLRARRRTTSSRIVSSILVPFPVRRASPSVSFRLSLACQLMVGNAGNPNSILASGTPVALSPCERRPPQVHARRRHVPNTTRRPLHARQAH